MIKQSNGFYIGIDSGGTKCELLIMPSNDLNGKAVYRKLYPGVHYSLTGPETYTDQVSGFIRHSLSQKKLSLNSCDGICVGIAGAREDNDRIKVRRLFAKKLKYKNVNVTTDAMTALYGAFEGDEGIILISGTGSVLYGFEKGIIKRVGGWGRIIGDEGSGYWIGKKGLNKIVKSYDNGTYRTSKLASLVKSRFRIRRANILDKVFYKNFPIQNIAPLVIDCAGKGDKESLEIVDKAVEGLMYHIKTYMKLSGRKKRIKIAFIGSVVENKNILSDKLKKEIRKLKIMDVVVKKHSSSFGAILLAAGNSSILSKLKT